MKAKTIFNHIKQLTSKKDIQYFDNLSVEDSKSYNVYMINRFLSMKYDWIDIVNYVQQFSQQLGKKGIHRVYDEIIPKGNTYLEYIKPNVNIVYNQIAVSILKKHFEIGENQAKEYYDTFLSSKELLYSFLEIIKKYGLASADYKKVEKEIVSAGRF